MGDGMKSNIQKDSILKIALLTFTALTITFSALLGLAVWQLGEAKVCALTGRVTLGLTCFNTHKYVRGIEHPSKNNPINDKGEK